MSSSPPPERQPAWNRPLSVGDLGQAQPATRAKRPLTLRAKLIIGIVALIIAVCAVVAVTTEIYLNRYLVGQVDKEVTQQQGFAKGGGPERLREEVPTNGLSAATRTVRSVLGRTSTACWRSVVDGEVIASGIPTAAGSGSYHLRSRTGVIAKHSWWRCRPTGGRARSRSTASATTARRPQSSVMEPC